MPKSKKTKQCNCIDACNEWLKPRGLTISTAFLLNQETGKARESTYMTTERVSRGGKQKRSHVFPSFCPFCGTSLATTKQPK